ncbi:hypothetical protein HPB47_015274 [Ixodes persulcatus]|uniref:Uncharacterized protein n=1 Tax=Ixodes persulcatus TaxID=34615 RepID=A0AC60QU31_IXOPE|nr:hypothetical protein HPB47_015274 [Ixodes persulcatus]
MSKTFDHVKCPGALPCDGPGVSGDRPVPAGGRRGSRLDLPAGRGARRVGGRRHSLEPVLGAAAHFGGDAAEGARPRGEKTLAATTAGPGPSENMAPPTPDGGERRAADVTVPGASSREPRPSPRRRATGSARGVVQTPSALHVRPAARG